MEKNEESVAKADKKEEMNEGPGEPCHDPGEFDEAEVANTAMATDRGEAAFIEIPEIGGFFPIELATDVSSGVFAGLHGRRRNTRDRISIFILDGNNVADGLDFGMSGNGEVLVDLGAALFVGFDGNFFCQTGGFVASGPNDGVAGDRTALQRDDPGFDVLNRVGEPDLNAERFKLLDGFSREVLGVSGKDARAGLDEDNAGVLGVNVAEIVGERVLGELADGTGHFDAGRTAADDHECHVGEAAVGVLDFLGFLKGSEDAAANLKGVVEAFKSGGEGFPFGVAKIRMSGTCGQNEMVVSEVALRTGEFTLLDVDPDDFGHFANDVALAAENGSDRLGNVSRGESCGGHLIEQRLEKMVICAVDQDDLDRRILERAGGGEPSKASANDRDHGQVGIFRV